MTWAGDPMRRSPVAGQVLSPPKAYDRAPPADCREPTGPGPAAWRADGGLLRTKTVTASYRPGEFDSRPLSASGESLRSGGYDSGREFALGRRKRKGAHAEPGLGPAGADIGAPAPEPALRFAQRDPAVRAKACSRRP